MNTWYLHLHNEPFEKFKNGTKIIEMRLYDEKRKQYKIGDEIVFENRINGEKLKVKIKDIKIFNTFQDLYNNFDKQALGYNQNDNASFKDLEIYYPIEEQLKNNVCAIEVEKIKD